MQLHSFSTYETSFNRHATILVLKTFTSMDWAHVSALQNLQSCKMSNVGQWLWLSWKSGCFRLQRSTVRIQSSAKIYIEFYYQLYWKVGIGPFFKQWFKMNKKYSSRKITRLAEKINLIILSSWNYTHYLW